MAQLANTSLELREVWEAPSIPAEQKRALLDAIVARAGFSRPVQREGAVRARERIGVTLAELMVVIVILGVMAGVTVVAFARRIPVTAGSPMLASIATARAEAVRSGTPETIRVGSADGLALATVYPDGRVVTNAAVAIDPLSGRTDDGSR